MRRYVPLIGVGVLAGLLLVVLLAATYTRPYTFHGSVIQDPSASPDFTLPDGPTGTFHLGSQRGKLVMIFFGYTNCQDVCPATLNELKLVRRRLGKDADRLQVVFITVDPGRDTPQKTSQYAQGFDPSFTGLSGSETQLDPVWKAYGVYHLLDKKSPTDTNYSVEHSTQIYLVDTFGNLRLTYSSDAPVDDVLQDARNLLRNH